MIEKLNIGYCGIDETQIFEAVPGRTKPNQYYCEFWLAIDDNSIAKHGICQKCYTILSDSIVVNLFERIKLSWLEEMEPWASVEKMDKVRARTVVSWGLSQETVYENIIDIEDLIKKAGDTEE